VVDEIPPDAAAGVIEAIKSVEPASGRILVEMDRAGDVGFPAGIPARDVVRDERPWPLG